MQVEEQKTNGSVRYDVMLTERRVEDLQILQKYGRKDEGPFKVVENTSEALASTYETFVHPFVAPMVTPAAAKAARALNPQRAQRWAVSDLNPFLWHGAREPGAARQRRPDGRDGALDGRRHIRLVGSLSRPARRLGGEHLLPHLRLGQHRHGRGG
jgi:hypothetical protein